MKETKSKSISDLFAEAKADETLFSGKKEKLEEKGKAPEQSMPTPIQKTEEKPMVLAYGVLNPWSARMIEKYSLNLGKEKEIGIGTVEGIGGRFFRKKIEGKPSTEKPIELWFDPEDGGINDFVDKKLSEGFNFVPLRAVEMETGEILTVSVDRRIPCRIGRRVKVLAKISEVGYVNFSLKLIRAEKGKEGSE